MSRMKMHLPAKTIDLIRSEEKKIEVRLFDEKRQKLKLGDEIDLLDLETEERALTVKVKALLIFPDFKSLYESFPAKDFGGDGWSIDQLVDNIHQFYSPEDEKKYGVVGIGISF